MYFFLQLTANTRNGRLGQLVPSRVVKESRKEAESVKNLLRNSAASLAFNKDSVQVKNNRSVTSKIVKV